MAALPNVLRSVLWATQETWLLLKKKKLVEPLPATPLPAKALSPTQSGCLSLSGNISPSIPFPTNPHNKLAFSPEDHHPGFLRCLHLDHAESLKGTTSKEEFSERFSATTPCCPKRAMEDLLEQKKRA